jgi:hypothetical protein
MLKFILGGGAQQAGMQVDKAALGQFSGGVLRQPGSLGAMNELIDKGDTAAAQAYLAANPEIMQGQSPEVAESVRAGKFAGPLTAPGTPEMDAPKVFKYSDILWAPQYWENARNWGAGYRNFIRQKKGEPLIPRYSQ